MHRGSTYVRFALSLAALTLTFSAEPAAARRTVIDLGKSIPVSGYCSPSSAGTADCFAYTLSSPLQIGGTTYSAFYVNSNGTVSLGSIEAFLGPQNSFSDGIPDQLHYTGPPPQTSLAEYPVPIFSPNFADGPGFASDNDPAAGFDGNFVATTALSPDGFTVSWFSCNTTITCGQPTIDLIAGTAFDENQVGLGLLIDTIIAASTLNDPNATNEQKFASGQQAFIAQIASTSPIYTMTLTSLPDGFQVDYSYSPGATGTTGTYGFSLPTGFFETTGLLQDRTFLFNSLGQPASVPEPMTWMTMLLGFGILGLALRRQRRLMVQLAA